jgi:hypothetical protein
VSAGGGAHVVPISSLTTFTQRWTIRARVVAKGDIRTWNNARGTGRLFSVTLVDDSATEIRATFFQEAVDRFNDLLQVRGAAGSRGPGGARSASHRGPTIASGSWALDAEPAGADRAGCCEGSTGLLAQRRTGCRGLNACAHTHAHVPLCMRSCRLRS